MIKRSGPESTGSGLLFYYGKNEKGNAAVFTKFGDFLALFASLRE